MPRILEVKIEGARTATVALDEEGIGSIVLVVEKPGFYRVNVPLKFSIKWIDCPDAILTLSLPDDGYEVIQPEGNIVSEDDIPF